MERVTARTLIGWLLEGKYDLDREVRIEVEWTDYTSKALPEEGLLYMPIKYMKQHDWGIVLGLGNAEKESELA